MNKPTRVHKLVKIVPRSEFARVCVKQYGGVCRQYQESQRTKWFTCPTEEDPYNFKHWSFSLGNEEADILEIK